MKSKKNLNIKRKNLRTLYKKFASHILTNDHRGRMSNILSLKEALSLLKYGYSPKVSKIWADFVSLCECSFDDSAPKEDNFLKYFKFFVRRSWNRHRCGQWSMVILLTAQYCHEVEVHRTTSKIPEDYYISHVILRHPEKVQHLWVRGDLWQKVVRVSS